MHEFIEIVTSPGHWAFEALSDAVFAVPAYFLGRWRLRTHDRKVHSTNQENR